MGSFNAICAITSTEIKAGQPVVMVLLDYSWHTDYGLLDVFPAMTSVRGIFKGTYNASGWIVEADKVPHKDEECLYSPTRTRLLIHQDVWDAIHRDFCCNGKVDAELITLGQTKSGAAVELVEELISVVAFAARINHNILALPIHSSNHDYRKEHLLRIKLIKAHLRPSRPS